MQNSNRVLKQKLDEHSRWMSSTAERIFQRETESIANSINDDSPHSLIDVSTSLSALASYYGTKGSIELSAENSSGWESIERAALYRLYETKSKFRLFQRMGVPTTCD